MTLAQPQHTTSKLSSALEQILKSAPHRSEPPLRSLQSTKHGTSHSTERLDLRKAYRNLVNDDGDTTTPWEVIIGRPPA